MKIKIILFSLILLSGLVAEKGFAATNFDDIDRNNDGALSRYEWPFGGSSFNRYDLNGDGFVTRDEVISSQANRNYGNYGYDPYYNGYGNNLYPYQPTYNNYPAYAYNPNVYGSGVYGYGSGYGGYGYNPLGYGAPVSRNVVLAQTGINLLNGLIASLMVR